MPDFVLAIDALLAVVRVAVFGAAVGVAALAAVSVGVRTRRLSPFGPAGRLSRSAADPLFKPMERRVVRAGGQPAHAPWWTLGAVVVGGLVLIAVLGFLRDQLFGATLALGAGPRGLAVLLLAWAFGLLRLALLVRVLSSWVRMSPWSPWVRWAFGLTDWFMRPLQRVIPPLGPVDISPLIAYFGLGLLQGVVTRAAGGL